MSSGKGAQKNEGTLTRQEILQSAAEFDPESIRYLSFDRRQLINIDSLREFKNLVHLNLSYNSICVLDPLKEVNTLNFLNLASNKITNIDALGYLDALEDLNLSGNLLTSTDRLKCLCSTVSLRKLRLQDNIHDLRNPLCKENGYQFTLLDMLPQLVVFDGERVKGRGSDLFKMCRDLDKQIESGRSFGPVVERPLPDAWFKSNYLKFAPEKKRISKSEIEFEKVLRECKRLDETVAGKIELLKEC